MATQHLNASGDDVKTLRIPRIASQYGSQILKARNGGTGRALSACAEDEFVVPSGDLLPLESTDMSTGARLPSDAMAGPTRPIPSLKLRRMFPGWLIAIFAILIVIGGAVAIWLIPPKLGGLWSSAAPIPSPTPSSAPPTGSAVTWVAAQTVLFAIGGAIAILGFALSFARHQDERRSAEFDRLKEKTRIAEVAQ